MVVAHNVAVVLWEIEKERQVRARILKKNLPTKPKRSTKPKPTAVVASSGNVDKESDDEALEDDDEL
jgi:hypothetical protein